MSTLPVWAFVSADVEDMMVVGGVFFVSMAMSTRLRLMAGFFVASMHVMPKRLPLRSRLGIGAAVQYSCQVVL